MPDDSPASPEPSSPVEQPWPRPGDKLFDAEGGEWSLIARLDFEHPDFAYYCPGYREAAESLIEVVSGNEDLLDFCIYPIVFLYRHYVELRLKETILYTRRLLNQEACFPNHHDLLQLWRERKQILSQARACPPEEEEAIVERLIKELAEADPKSFAFRYPVDKKGDPALPKISHISVKNLRDTMERLGNFLDAEAEYVLIALQTQQEMASDWP
jgi:hypothetical protein